MTQYNMRAIQTVTVGAGGASTIQFTSIPQTYTDLKILLSARSTGTNQTISIQFNSDTTSTNYRRLALGAAGSTTFSQNINDQGIGYMPISTYTANTFGNAEIYIPNYTSTSAKSFYTDSVAENNAAEAYLGLIANTYTGTAAISSITLSGSANFAQYSTATLYGITSAGAKATGGEITYDGTYFYHTFLASGTFTPTTALTADYLVVAGGGGGGGWQGGGGGAGGYRTTVGTSGGGGSAESAISLTAQAYTVTVGAGGAGGPYANPGTGSNGSNSVFGSITSTGGGGGGGGGAGDSNTNGQNGGSGGGGALRSSISSSGGSGTANQGYAGGGGGNAGAGDYATGGGGGAGAVGGTVSGGSYTGGNGGTGVSSSISGLSVTRAGGGGGHGAGTGGTGGAGGGGNGSTGTGPCTAGTALTGGGGGGGRDQAGANGGSGIVIIRYAG